MDVFHYLTRFELCKCEAASRRWHEISRSNCDSLAVFVGRLGIHVVSNHVRRPGWQGPGPISGKARGHGGGELKTVDYKTFLIHLKHRSSIISS